MIDKREEVLVLYDGKGMSCTYIYIRCFGLIMRTTST